jgi:hypothetical protein
MAIIYSQTKSTFEYFVRSYGLLVEDGIGFCLDIQDSERRALWEVYKEMRRREIEPVLYLTHCFRNRCLVLPESMIGYLGTFTYKGTYYPVEKIRRVVEYEKENLENWSNDRHDYYRLFEPSPMLAVFDPVIRRLVFLNRLNMFRSRYQIQLLWMINSMKYRHTTRKILEDIWIPFVEGSV